MKKILKLNTALTDFEDVELKDAKGVETLTFKKALLEYISFAHLMGLQPNEELSLYFIGRKLGRTKGVDLMKLDIADYNLLHKITNNGKIQQPGGAMQPIFTLIVAQQVNALLDAADNDKEEEGS